jgi:hypothetical protein
MKGPHGRELGRFRSLQRVVFVPAPHRRDPLVQGTFTCLLPIRRILEEALQMPRVVLRLVVGVSFVVGSTPCLGQDSTSPQSTLFAAQWHSTKHVVVPNSQREVFANLPGFNVVDAIARYTSDGHKGVLIIASGSTSESCFVPDGGVTACVPLRGVVVAGAELAQGRSPDSAALFVSGLWGEPAVALVNASGDVVWRYDAKFTAMGHFALLRSSSGLEAVVAEPDAGLVYFDALSGKRQATVTLPGVLTDIFTLSKKDGQQYLLGVAGSGKIVALSAAGSVLKVSPSLGVFHAATAAGDSSVLFIAPADTVYAIDEQLQRSGGWLAPGSADLHITAIDRNAGPTEATVAVFVGSGSARLTTGLYAFGPTGQLLLRDQSLYPTSGLLLLRNDEHSMVFLVGDRERVWQYTVNW